MKITHLLLLLVFTLMGFADDPKSTKPEKSQEEAKRFEEEKKAWPKTVDEAVTRIVTALPEKDRKIIRETARKDLIRFHHGWGTGIRNDFGLWRGNDALMKDCKAQHPDEASSVIIDAVWVRLQAKK